MRGDFWILGAALSVSGCGWTEPKTPAADARTAKDKQANVRRLKRACGSSMTYDRLKAMAFEQATEIRGGDSAVLDRLAAGSAMRMENPVAKSRDDTLNVTVCTGKLILELPPGAEDAFDGDRRLEAEVEYAAQEAVDGSGLVYQMQGADAIIYRLAAIDLKQGGRTAAVATTVQTVPPAPVQPAPAQAAPPLVSAVPPAPLARPDYVAPAPVPVRPASAARPSFRCGSARSRVERMICGDQGLAARDRAMSSAFYAALANADGRTRSALRSSRDRFLGFRDRCPNQACVAQSYADRIDEIRDIAADGG